MSRRLLAGFLALLSASAIALTACAEAAEPTATQPTFNPTPAPQGSPTAPASPSGTGTPAVTATAPSGNGGDPAQGEQLFTSGATPPCSSCHATTDTRIVGPGLAGVYARARTRVSGLSADEYITQSIREPGAFVVDGFTNLMPPFPPSNLSDQEVQHIIAYLRTLQ